MKFAVRTGLEPVTPCVTGMYSNQAELTHLIGEMSVPETGDAENRGAKIR